MGDVKPSAQDLDLVVAEQAAKHATAPKKLLPIVMLDETVVGYAFWCPACDEPHRFRLEGGAGAPVWTFNGDMEKPTFTPSLCYPGKCHLFVTDGKICYCTDSQHALAGQSVEIPEWPI